MTDELFPVEATIHPHRALFEAWKVRYGIQTHQDNSDMEPGRTFWRASGMIEGREVLADDFSEEEACSLLCEDGIPHWLEPLAKGGAA